MFSIRPRVRMTAPPSFSAQQFSASTRSAALLLLILSVLAALSILFAPAVQGQTFSATLNARVNSTFVPQAWEACGTALPTQVRAASSPCRAGS